MPFVPDPERHDRMPYRRCGASGLMLPAISLGLWHNFGDDRGLDGKRAICRTALDLGITHFDLANNYGPPPGSAEEAFGEIMRRDFAGHRDELIISSKAGYRMWDGPYGEWGSRKYLIASCDQSLKRMGLDYVDIFYSHRFDPDTPLEETMGALDRIVRSGRALYAGISSYTSAQTRAAAAILKDLGTPCLIHQPSYSMLNRWLDRDGLKSVLTELGIGSIAFSPLAQGLLTGRYLGGLAEGSRATQGGFLKASMVNPQSVAALNALNGIAARRGQTLAQMALAWVLRDDPAGCGITSALIGASRPEQVIECAGAVGNLAFSAREMAEIDALADEARFAAWAEAAGPALPAAGSGVVRRATPSNPAKPAKSAKAAKPAKPAKSAKPGRTAKPAKSGKPGKPRRA
jgi:L-glyceraldehyde 3-phosphate reductase